MDVRRAKVAPYRVIARHACRLGVRSATKQTDTAKRDRRLVLTTETLRVSTGLRAGTSGHESIVSPTTRGTIRATREMEPESE